MHPTVKAALIAGVFSVIAVIVGPVASRLSGREEANELEASASLTQGGSDRFDLYAVELGATTDSNGAFAIAHNAEGDVVGVFARYRRRGDPAKWYQLRTIPGETAVLSWDATVVYGYLGNPEFANTEVRVTVVAKSPAEVPAEKSSN